MQDLFKQVVAYLCKAVCFDFIMEREKKFTECVSVLAFQHIWESIYEREAQAISLTFP